MDTITIVGSILSFKESGISEKELRNISDFLLSNYSIYVSKSISGLYYELDLIDDYFFLNGSILNYDEYYVGKGYLRKRYFDSLSSNDKTIIYSLLNLVQ